MSLFALFGFSISSLRFSMGLALGSASTLWTAVSLSPPATPADTEHPAAPSALDLE
jgi:hypothetical protein